MTNELRNIVKNTSMIVMVVLVVVSQREIRKAQATARKAIATAEEMENAAWASQKNAQRANDLLNRIFGISNRDAEIYVDRLEVTPTRYGYEIKVSTNNPIHWKTNHANLLWKSVPSKDPLEGFDPDKPLTIIDHSGTNGWPGPTNQLILTNNQTIAVTSSNKPSVGYSVEVVMNGQVLCQLDNVTQVITNHEENCTLVKFDGGKHQFHAWM